MMVCGVTPLTATTWPATCSRRILLVDSMVPDSGIRASASG
jgi:hypothetical protein